MSSEPGETRAAAFRATPAAGYTVLEVLVAGLLATLAVVTGAPALTAARSEVLIGGATTYLATRIRQVRVEAARRRTHAGLRFEADGAGLWRLQPYVDGDDDGIRTADIDAGIDRPSGPGIRIDRACPGVGLGVLPGVTPVDPADSLADGNPVRFGRSALVSCSPEGGCTSGSLYLVGPGQQQAVVRVLGGTGRVRAGRYAWNLNRWTLR